MTKKRKIKKIPVIVLIIIILLLILVIILSNGKKPEKKQIIENFLSSTCETVKMYDENYNEVMELPRGTKIQELEKVMTEEQTYIKIIYDNQTYLVKEENINEDIVKEKQMYVRTPTILYENETDGKILSYLKKGEELQIIGYDKLNQGKVNMYKIKYNDQEGYVYEKYLKQDQQEALKNYDNGYFQTHLNRSDTLGGGDAASLDYYPYEKPKFENNIMPDEVRSLYINVQSIKNIDEYIEYAKTTNINAFVVDIKDNTQPAYKSEVMKELSPTNYEKAFLSIEEYKEAIKKIKDNNFYVIGRITTFKDDYFIADHKEYAIARNGSPLKYSSAYWPSAFQRGVWEFNVGLAIEAVKEMGFNEIQFDYVRFPDRMQSIEKSLDYLNKYNETKAQAIQRFVMYATDILHKYNVYVSIDVFGESSWGYVTAYGQYWPAISNVADVISAMPYTDHFDRNNSNYWTNPYNTMKTWGKTAADRQTEIPTPAIARTWITAYNTPYWNPTVPYNGEKLTEQINGLYEVGLKGGYMTWNSASNLEKYKLQKSAFTKEYK